MFLKVNFVYKDYANAWKTERRKQLKYVRVYTIIKLKLFSFYLNY